jgi:hypothetical protein
VLATNLPDVSLTILSDAVKIFTRSEFFTGQFMNIDWSRVAPVLVSIGIIIAIAILRQYSKAFAAIAATMPINIPLGMWIVYSGAVDSQAALTEFSEAVLLNILPTIAFMVLAWQMTKAGYSVLPTIIAGYIVWAVCLGIIVLIRAQLAR